MEMTQLVQVFDTEDNTCKTRALPRVTAGDGILVNKSVVNATGATTYRVQLNPAAIAGLIGSASDTAQGLVALAVPGEYPALIGNNTQATTPAYVNLAVNTALANYEPDQATSSSAGIVELATSANYPSVTNNVDAATPAYVASAISAIPAASNTIPGLVSLAVAANHPSTSNTEATTPAYVSTAISAAIANIPADVFLTSLASYNPTSNVLTLNLSDGSTVPVDMTGLVNDAVASIPTATDTVAGKVTLAVAANYPSTSNVEATTPAYVTTAVNTAIAAIPALPNATDTVSGKVSLAVVANFPSTSNVEAATPAYVTAAIIDAENLAVPADFGALETGNNTAALTAWLASPLLKHADADKVHTFSSALTIPSGTVLEGKLNLVWTGAGSVPILTIGDNVEIEHLDIKVPTTTGNSMTIGTGYKGQSIVVTGSGNSGAGFIDIPDTAGLDLDLLECKGGFQRAFTLGNKDAWSFGGRVGTIRVRDYTRGIGINYLDGFTLEHYDIRGRNALASFTAGHNGILVSGLRNSTFGAGVITDAGEHLIRFAGEALLGPSYNNSFGDMELENPGGSFVKINADAIAEDFRFGDIRALGKFVTTGGNKELLRLSHCKNIYFGNVTLSAADGFTYSAEDALALNDVDGIFISHLHVEDLNQSVIDANSGQDIGTGLGDGDVKNVYIGGLTGYNPTNRTVVTFAMATGFTVSDIHISNMNYFTDGALYFGSGTTVVSGPCSISGRFRKTDINTLPLTTNLPANMAIDFTIDHRHVENEAGVLVWADDVIRPNLIEPQGQLTGIQSGMRLESQAGAVWAMRSDPYAGLNTNIRWRQSGSGNTDLWWVFSEDDNPTNWFAFNPSENAIRCGDGITFQDDTGANLFRVKPTGVVTSRQFTVATLPDPTTNEFGRAFVNDSTVPMLGNAGAVVIGGGTRTVPVFSNGNQWIIG
jgi:hypothetical protein